MEKWKHLAIPLSKIKDATNNFERLIGSGGYGSVYEGKILINEKYIHVAVKRLNERFGQGLKEFLTEIDLLSGTQHDNLVTLVGYCHDEHEKILVYEYAKNGSLEQYITPTNTDHNVNLTWLERLGIVVDAARGLDHLHNHLRNNQVIIHRDIKSSNILLDHKWVAKISDFGLSTLTFGGVGRSIVITNACGTQGYVAPEVVNQSCMVTKESDVYSFGVVLFEVLCGRLCNNRSQDGVLLTAEVAKEYYSNNKLDEIIDPVLREQMNKKSLEKYSAIAYSCLQERQQRPQMYEVRKKLEEALKIQDFYTQTPEGNHLQMPYSEIDDAIESYFKAEIGSEEYRIDVPEQEGYLYVHDIHTQVTVRDYNYWSFDSEFYADLKWLMDQQHENVVTLIGYCDEADHKCIVYEYPKHGSLNDYIECSNELNHTLTWLERLKIIVDVANGMEHIQNCGGRLIAITSTNILLYDKWLAKISNRRYFSARFEHLEPYHDLYIYIGMLLFELLCGRLSTVYEHCRRGCLSPIEAKQHYESKELDKIIDPILRKQMSLESLTKFSALAYKCLQTPPDDPSLLIDMKKELEETLKFEVRYWRSFFSRHWYILNVNDLSPGTDIVMMQHQDTKRLEGPSGSREDRGDK